MPRECYLEGMKQRHSKCSNMPNQQTCINSSFTKLYQFRLQTHNNHPYSLVFQALNVIASALSLMWTLT